MIFFYGSSRCLLSLRGRKILRTRPTSRKQSCSEKIRVPAQTRIYSPRGMGQVIDPLRAPFVTYQLGCHHVLLLTPGDCGITWNNMWEGQKWWGSIGFCSSFPGKGRSPSVSSPVSGGNEEVSQRCCEGGMRQPLGVSLTRALQEADAPLKLVSFAQGVSHLSWSMGRFPGWEAMASSKASGWFLEWTSCDL